MNYIQNYTTFRNNYFAMRHGQSETNALHIINGEPAIGTLSYGLTDQGRQEIERAIVNETELNQSTIVYCSDFLRTCQTAEIVCGLIKCTDIHLTPLLRERYFGEYEGQSADYYNQIYQADRDHYAEVVHEVESLAQLIDRTTRLIVQLEQQYTNRTILLISHGDTIQMLQAAFEKIEPPAHQTIMNPRTGSIIHLQAHV